MEGELGNVGFNPEQNKPLDTSVSNEPDRIQEKTGGKENEILGRAIKEVNEVQNGGKKIVYANRQYANTVGQALGRVKGVATNGRPGEAGYSQVQQVHEQVGEGIRSTLIQLGKNLDSSVVPPNAPAEIEALIKKALSTPDPQEARKIAESAINSFGMMITGVANKTEGFQQLRRKVSERSDENEQESRRLAQRLTSDLTQNYAGASRNLSQEVHGSDPRTKDVENGENAENRNRFARFSKALSELPFASQEVPSPDSNSSSLENRDL